MINWYNFGTFMESESITPQIIENLLQKAKEKRDQFAAVPIMRIAEVLDRISKKLQDEQHPARRKTMQIMPDLIHFSDEMVKAGLDAICENLKFESIVKRLKIDLDDIGYIDDFTYNPTFDGYIKAVPQGVLSHISAGNVFVGAIDTLVQGIITKNINILKMSSFDPVFPLIFAELLIECDPEQLVSPYFALIPFKGGDKEIEEIIKQESDVVIVYGGKNAVEAYRNNRGLFTKDVEFGPKYSCMVIDSSELAKHDVAEIARLAARDFTMWEQSACSSPHSIFIDGKENAVRFAEEMKKAFVQLQSEFPFPEINTDEKMEITRTRELARVDQALGNSELIIPAVNDQSWSVIVEYKPVFQISCQHRTAYIIAIDNFEQVIDALSGYGKFIQSVGILADYSKLFDYAARLTQLGADRITEIGAMSQRKHGTPHDGTRGLAEYVKWVSVGHPLDFIDPFDYKTDKERDELSLARLNHLIGYAREKSSFYRETLPDVQLKSLKDLSKLPVLKQEQFRDKLPPYGDGILTAPLGSSISFGSGGTSGHPKFVYRTMEETRRNAKAMAKGLAVKMFQKGDVVANLFFAGNMWASFISVNMALEEIGCHILPIGGHVGIENIMSYLKSFKVDAIISIPSILISIAEYVEKNGLKDIKIKKIAYGGEHLAPAAEEYLKRVLGTEIVGSATYAINDTGVVAFQCECCSGSVHHVMEDLHIVEIVDPETFEPLPDGEAGNIILTNIDRKLMPVIRYDVGDRGRLLTHKCACGRQARLLELLGRSDEVLIIGGDNISVDAVSQAVAKVQGLSQKFSMIGKYLGHLDLLEIRVEGFGIMDDDRKDLLAKELIVALLTEKPALQAFLNANSIARPSVIVMNEGELPANPRTGKIKRVIDERHSS